MREPAQGGGTAPETDLDVSLNCDNLSGMRAEISRLLAGTEQVLIQDVELVATELASNACEHADDPRRLRLRRDAKELLIEVWDASPDQTPVVGRSSLGEHRGRGMVLVTKLCDDWGVRMDADCKVVWGRMRLNR
jgi:anti-sigma regulatory factor (Ser/Thr protein kinase)